MIEQISLTLVLVILIFLDLQHAAMSYKTVGVISLFEVFGIAFVGTIVAFAIWL